MTKTRNPLPQHPELSWNDNGQPISDRFEDPYYSDDNGLEESRYVFLQHNGLPQRWKHWQGPFCIVETGFGTGRNFLLAWQTFAQEAGPDCWLDFTSIEKYPMSTAQLAKALACWPELSELTALLLTQYPDAIAGFHHLQWPQQRVRLTLIIGDASEVMADISGPVHAWFLDGFAPARNPDMWSDNLFRHIRRISLRHPQLAGITTAATYTAAGLVRRGLAGAGFRMHRVEGFGRKHEMLCGCYEQTLGPERPRQHWFKPWLLAAPPIQEKRIAVIGAGLAGCTTAAALANRGYRVDIFDANGIASGASGNPQGGLYIKLAASDNATHSEFYLTAYLASLRLMQQLDATTQPGDGKLWDSCGVIQQAFDEAENHRQARFMEVSQYPHSLIHTLDAKQATEIAGTQQDQGGLFFPDAGWVSPVEFCQRLVRHPLIQVHIQKVEKISHIPTSTDQTDDQGYWELQLPDGTQHPFPQVVIATASRACDLLPDACLPVKSIRGQLTIFNATELPAIKTVLCGHAYTAPSLNGQAVIGATYHQGDNCEELRKADDEQNMKHSLEFGPDFSDRCQTFQVIGGRVGFRCTTPDYLPMVGSLPFRSKFVQKFKILSSNARKIPEVEAPVLPGLWLNIGHGSRGLASTPICAEILASEITGSSRPVSERVFEALWPGRFLLRDMIRKKLPISEYK